MDTSATSAPYNSGLGSPCPAWWLNWLLLLAGADKLWLSTLTNSLTGRVCHSLRKQKVGIQNGDTTFIAFGYDSRGRRTSVTDQNGKVTSYTYNDADRLTSVTNAAQNVTTYGYDTKNNLLSITSHDFERHTAKDRLFTGILR
jgi:YD repeat-containing protein